MEPEVQAVLRQLAEAEASLEARLREIPLFRELEAVRAAKRQLATNVGSPNERPHVPVAEYTVTTKLSPPPSRPMNGTNAARYITFASELIRQTGRRATSGAVVDFMIGKGEPIPDRKKAVSAVSSTLSHCGQFQNGADERGSGYWPLVEWPEVAVTFAPPE